MTSALIDIGPLRSSCQFRRLWLGRTFSGFGSQMTLVAVMFQVWQQSTSTVWVGAVGLAQALPLIVFGLFAGSIIDRSDWRKLYLLATTGQAACSVLLAGQALFGQRSVFDVLVVVAAQACFGAGAGPAAMLVGPGVSGLVLGWLGVTGCYLIDAISFTLASYGALGLPTLRPEGEPSRPGIFGIRDGVRFLLHTGGVIASMFSGAFTRLRRPGAIMLLGSAVWGVALALFGIAPNPWIGLCKLVLAGIADTISVVSRSTIVQLHTPDELRGRLAAAEQIIGQAGPDLGNMRGGLVANATSGTVALVSGGLLCLAAVTVIATTTPGLRRFTTPRPPHEAAPTS